jgi:hypothetical protein
MLRKWLLMAIIALLALTFHRVPRVDGRFTGLRVREDRDLARDAVANAEREIKFTVTPSPNDME